MSKESAKMTIGLIVGSAYHAESPPGLQLTAKQVATPHGTVVLRIPFNLNTQSGGT